MLRRNYLREWPNGYSQTQSEALFPKKIFRDRPSCSVHFDFPVKIMRRYWERTSVRRKCFLCSVHCHVISASKIRWTAKSMKISSWVRCVCVSNSVFVVFGTNPASDTFHNSYKVKLRENKSCDYLIERLLGLQQCLWGVLAVQEFLLKTFSLFSPLLATQFGPSCLDRSYSWLL